MNGIHNITVIGLGYIGLPTAIIFANAGVEVFGFDVNEQVQNTLKKGLPHIVEPNLDQLLKDVIKSKKLQITSEIKESDVFLIAVPTPFKIDKGTAKVPDLSYIKSAVEMLAPVLKKNNLIILESTSPIGTTELISEWLAELRPDLTFPHLHGELSDVRIAHCPERVLPGKIFEELIYNTRIVGGITRKCAQLAANFYKIVVKGECHTTNARTAELVKLTENAFRDVNIAFANELSMICDKDKINIWELIRLANLHPRVNILSPGPGVGGHCIAVDPWFIVHGNPKEAQLIKKAREVNDHKPHYILKKIEEKAKTLKSPVIACLGLTYKKDVDDIRESPALDIVENLSQKRLGKILVVEPYLNKIPDHLHNLSLKLSDFDQAIEAANIVVLLVDHSAFQYIDRETLNGKFVIDTRGMWS